MSRTRVAIIFAAVLALFGAILAPAANAASPICDSACVLQTLQNGTFVPAPLGPGIRTVAADGSMLYYTNEKNEVEFRLSHDKTTEVIKNSYYIYHDSISLGLLFVPGGQTEAVMKMVPAWLPKAAGVAGIGLNRIDSKADFVDAAVKSMQRDLCLGVTVYPSSLKGILNRSLATYAAMAQGQLGGIPAAMAGIKAVWLEPCSLNHGQLSDAMKPKTLADIGQAPKPPAAAPAPATPAQPIGITGYSIANVKYSGWDFAYFMSGPAVGGNAVLGTMRDGERVTILCQRLNGERVRSPKTGYVSYVWDKIARADGKVGWVSDLLTNTPGINQRLAGAPLC